MQPVAIPAHAGLEEIARQFDLLSVYLFGSRADDGLALLAGEAVRREGSDLDVGVFFRRHDFDVCLLADLQVEMEDLFAPLRVDLVPLQRVDPIFQFRAVDGHRVAAPDSTAANFHELVVMRMAAELIYIQDHLEVEMFGRSKM